MSIVKHEAIVATLRRNQHIDDVLAFRDQMPNGYAQLLVGPAERMNGVVSFALLPDGSGEGWALSDEMDDIRAAFIALLERIEAHWVHLVLYDEGADQPQNLSPHIVASSGFQFDGQYWHPVTRLT